MTKYSYFYKGQPLKDYCVENEIKFDVLRQRILREKRNFPNKPFQEIVDSVVENYTGNSHYLYNYEGRPAYLFCNERGINYSSLIKSVYSKKRKLEERTKGCIGISVDDLLKEFLDNFKKYEDMMYRGISLIKYCVENKVNTFPVVSYIERHKNQLTGYSNDELLDMAVYSALNGETVYFYKGESVHSYCRKKGYLVSSLLSYITRTMKSESNKTFKEVVEYCVETYTPPEPTKYLYKDIPVAKICKMIGIEDNNIHKRIGDLTANGMDLSNAIEEAVKYYLNTDLIYKEKILFDYCIDNNYKYLDVLGIYDRLKEKYENASDDKLIKEAIRLYEYRSTPEYLNKMFNVLRSNDSKNIKVLKRVTDSMNLDLSTVVEIIDKGYSPYTSALIVWYFGNNYTQENNLLITDKQLDKVLLLVDVLKNGSYDKIKHIYNKANLFLLIKLYKCNLYDTLDIIIKKYSDYKDELIDSLKVPNTYYGLLSKVFNDGLVAAIDQTPSNNETVFFETINNYVKKYLIDYRDAYLIDNKKLKYTPKKEDDK